MKKTLILTLSAGLSMFILFQSCKKEKNEQLNKSLTNSSSVSVQGDAKFKNDAAVFYARAVSMAVENADVRLWLKKKALEEVDGDFDILHSMVKNEIVSNGRTWSMILSEVSGQSIDYFTVILPQAYPSLNMLIPDIYYPENWNTATVIPGVTAIPCDIDEQKGTMLHIYSAHPNMDIDLFSHIEPKDMTICVGESERVEAFTLGEKPDGESKKIFEDGNYVLYQTLGLSKSFSQSDYNEEILNINGNTKRGCQRDKSGKKDRMILMRVRNNTSVNELEKWYQGKLELVYTMIYNSSGNILSTVSNGHVCDRRAVWDSKWIHLDAEGPGDVLLTWDKKDKYGDVMKYIWIEDDGGTPKSIPIELEFKNSSGTTITLKTTIQRKNRDQKAGESLSEYCDNVYSGVQELTTSHIGFCIVI
ncbi:MAG: hypothetical protein H7321_07370 [Bacteroidia bacterium]|nr:hypothetical protein [Bacteroidia bacterium]